MARRRGGATSRFTGEIPKSAGKSATSAVVWLCFCLLFPSAAEAGLYTATDQLLPLSPDNVEPLLINSTAAVLVEFYASWCGHCIAFSPVYKRLARDIKEWKPAVDLAAIDCAAEENRKVCTAFGIKAYPTIKFFHAYSKADSKGQSFRASTHEVWVLRHRIIDKLESHEEPWPPACPPLEPTSQAEIDSFFETNNVQHLALIFEDATSYIGREVTLDLLQFENVAVRRVLSTEEGLVTKLGVTEFPSCYLYSAGGNFTRLKVNIEARAFYSYALQALPGVRRSGKPPPVAAGVVTNHTPEPWKPFNRSRVYMADLESTLHYSLRVELAAHTVIKGGALTSLREYVSVLAKYFPGRPVVTNLLKSLNAWLQNQTGDEISYEALREILDNTAQSPNTALPEGERWVACQGSQPHFRRYPCGMWSLFHVLTVQAKDAGGTDPKEVLSAMRSYVHSFFGCRACAEHFEVMAEESLVEVDTLSSAVLWLWSRHNRVNNRLAGALSEDPNFPKVQWPSPEMCPGCHSVKDNGEHRWSQPQVLPFLMSYFSSSSILADHLEDENQILAKQREKHALLSQQRVERKAREASDSMMHPLPSQSTVQDEEEEEEEEEEDEEDAEEEEGDGLELDDEDHDEGFGSEHELSDNEEEEEDEEEDEDYEADKDDDMSDAFSEPGCDMELTEDIKGLTAGVSSRKRGKRRYFWEYSEQLTPSKQERMLKPSEWDRHTLPSNLYQKNGPLHGKYMLKKSRRTDVEDLTPNPRKLLQIGTELRKLNKVISDLTPVSELPLTARPRSRKEKNKLASRACRLKKKAQYEANKVKLWGLSTEYDRLLFVINAIKEEIVSRVEDSSPRPTNMAETLEHLIKETLVSSPVAGETSDFVNKILENTGHGDPTGGLVGLRVPTSKV